MIAKRTYSFNIKVSLPRYCSVSHFFSRLIIKSLFNPAAWLGIMLQAPLRKILKRILVASTLVGLVVPILYVAGRRIYNVSASQVQQLFTPKNVQVVIADVANPVLQAAIRDYVTNYTTQDSLLNLDPKTFVAQLQTKFPVIKKVTYTYVPPQTIAFDITGTKPICVVNNRFIVGNQEKVLALSTFAPDITAALPRITIDQKLLTKGLPARTYRWLESVTPYHWQTFAMTYHAPWHIDLVPHQAACPCVIVASEKSSFDTKKLTSIKAIFKDLCTRGVITPKLLDGKKARLAYDIRIPGQIVVKGEGS